MSSPSSQIETFERLVDCVLLIDGDPVQQHDPETEFVVHPSSPPLPG